MSRHRAIRSKHFVDDDDDDYDYGHSVEDNYCISPATAEQFTFNRDSNRPLGEYFSEIPEEDVGSDDSAEGTSLGDSGHGLTAHLSDMQKAQLFSCLDQVRGVLGDSHTEGVLTRAAINANFDSERTINSLLGQGSSPPQASGRRQGGRRGMSQDMPAPQPAPPSAAGATADAVTKPIARMTFSGNSGASAGAPSTPQAAASTLEGATADAATPKGPSPTPRSPAVKTLREEGTKPRSRSGTPVGAPRTREEGDTPSVSTPARSMKKTRKTEDAVAAFKEREAGKPLLNMVVIGHVDAGKSTLMGHVLYSIGYVGKRQMHKYEQESKKLGKASFAYAWVLDETEEERARGVTMDVAQTRFETDHRVINLLDAPGHKDFIPNMITGTAGADVALLVVNGTRGEFESGFEAGGQTREHTMLARSLGVQQLLVAVNKMDTVDWSEDRYNEVTGKLRTFMLKTAQFKEADIRFVPCSGLVGQNLVSRDSLPPEAAWYKGPCLLQLIDDFASPQRAVEDRTRVCVSDVYRGGQGSGISVAGRLESGSAAPGDRLLVLPMGEIATVKAVTVDEQPVPLAFAGDQVTLTLQGVDIAVIGVGNVLCEAERPVPVASRIVARIVVLDTPIPLTRGFPVVLHMQSLTQPGFIKKLVAHNTKSGVKNKPRCLPKHSQGVVEIELHKAICFERYRDCRALGRFMLRDGGRTLAAGMVEEVKLAKRKRAD